MGFYFELKAESSRTITYRTRNKKERAAVEAIARSVIIYIREDIDLNSDQNAKS